MDEEDVRRLTREAIGDVQLEDSAWISAGVEGYELARAMLFALSKRFGSAFVDDVATALNERMAKLGEWGDLQALEQKTAIQHSTIWTDLDDAERITRSDG